MDASNYKLQNGVDVKSAYRTHSCGELRAADIGKTVTLSGWVQKMRDMNHFAFVDIRDRYGITQCVFPNTQGKDEKKDALYNIARTLGREDVIQIVGVMVERSNKNKDRDTGEVEITVETITVLNKSLTPPFTIEDETDGKGDIRWKYRYLDIRRNPVRDRLLLRSFLAQNVRTFLMSRNFVEIETPVFIKSTPEGARDFVVPSRMNPGKFYALPQSPQTFKQILMVGGIDRYFQIVKCFRDEELRADRQPEFTQIDCEMAFVDQNDVLDVFEGMIRAIFIKMLDHEFPTFPRMTWAEAMENYGIDKPDLRYEMKLKYVTDLVKKGEEGYVFFNEAETVVAISVPGKWTKKKAEKLKKLTASEMVKATGYYWVIVGAEGKHNTSLKKLSPEDLNAIVERTEAKEGDLITIFCGDKLKTQEAMGKFRNEMGEQLGYKKEGFKACWVVDFPMFEWDEEAKRFSAMHHPFTAAHADDKHLMATDPGLARSTGYDLVINGVEVGGGSERISNADDQHQAFKILGFTPEQAEEQFGFLLGAFKYGAPPHAGLALGFDRLCTIIGGGSSIKEYIAFPKNNTGRDIMIDAPSYITKEQQAELYIATVEKKKQGEEGKEEKTE